MLYQGAVLLLTEGWLSLFPLNRAIYYMGLTVESTKGQDGVTHHTAHVHAWMR